jgi:hypothetical protein
MSEQKPGNKTLANDHGPHESGLNPSSGLGARGFPMCSPQDVKSLPAGAALLCGLHRRVPLLPESGIL